MGKGKKEESSGSESSDAFDDSLSSKSEDKKKYKKKSDRTISTEAKTINKNGEEYRVYPVKHTLKNGEVVVYGSSMYKPTGRPRGIPSTPLSRVRRLAGELNTEQLTKIEKYMKKMKNGE